ncbi:MAG: SpoIIIAH-like family protein [Carboxydocellales bacterium]
MRRNKNSMWLLALALSVTLLWLSYDDQIVSTIRSLRYNPENSTVQFPQNSSDKELANLATDKLDQQSAELEQELTKKQGSTQTAVGQTKETTDLTLDEQKFNDLLVAASANNPADKFFAEYRLERDRVRGQQVDNLREIVNNPKSVVETIREAQKRLLSLNENLSKELLVENMLRAKHYNDAIVFLQDGAVTVIVQAKELNQQDIAKIADLITRTTGKSAQEMVIIPKN